MLRRFFLIPELFFFGIIFSAQAQHVKPIVCIDNFQKTNSITIHKSIWYTFSDIGNGGKSSIAYSYQKENNSKNKHLTVDYTLDQGSWQWTPYAALACSLTIKQISPGIQAIAYEFKGNSHNLVYRSDNIKDYAFYQKVIPASEEWTTVTIPISELTQPSWGSRKPFIESDLNSLAWQVTGQSGDSGVFSIDNVRFLYTPQLTLPSEKKSQNEIHFGFKETIHSCILDEDRDLWVSLPIPLAEMKVSNKKYPVVYVLDGDSHIKSLSSMMEELSPHNGNAVLPEMIVVGIPNTNRWRDLSPNHVNRTPFGTDTVLLKSTGGGEKFIQFIQKELIPHIDSVYATTSYRTFIGHSLGGLTVLNTLIYHPDIFNSYLAIDPSLWWNDQLLSKQAESMLKNINLQNKRLFIAVANTVSNGYDTSNIRKDTTQNALHMRCIFEFIDILRKQPTIDLKWKYVYYPDDSHNSVPTIAHYDGMRFFFDYYRIRFGDKIDNANFNIDSAITLHYKNISKEFGYNVSFEEAINNYGYRFMRMKRYQQALSCFKISTNNFPMSSKGWENLGDVYDKLGDIPNAILSYSKGLLIAEIPEMRKKINKLQEVSNK